MVLILYALVHCSPQVPETYILKSGLVKNFYERALLWVGNQYPPLYNNYLEKNISKIKSGCK